MLHVKIKKGSYSFNFIEETEKVENEKPQFVTLLADAYPWTGVGIISIHTGNRFFVNKNDLYTSPEEVATAKQYFDRVMNIFG